jgi:hypothetical protein
VPTIEIGAPDDRILSSESNVLTTRHEDLSQPVLEPVVTAPWKRILDF